MRVLCSGSARTSPDVPKIESGSVCPDCLASDLGRVTAKKCSSNRSGE